jgi:hypothetical protein
MKDTAAQKRYYVLRKFARGFTPQAESRQSPSAMRRAAAGRLHARLEIENSQPLSSMCSF